MGWEGAKVLEACPGEGNRCFSHARALVWLAGEPSNPAESGCRGASPADIGKHKGARAWALAE